MTTQTAAEDTAGMTAVERELRVQLAACYRIFAHLGWDENIYNHISVRVPGPEHHFLINPYGLHYTEVTASNLVKIDLAGNIVGESDYPVNPAGFIIHSAIHGAREDALCVAHTHTTAGSAVACQADGLRYDNFYSCLLKGKVGYHDFEGITVNPGEKERLIANLGEHNFLILRNHGLLTVGTTIPAAFQSMWAVQRSCEIQVACDSTGRELIPIDAGVAQTSSDRVAAMLMGNDYGQLEFSAFRRIIDRIDPSYQS
ncbi:MAG: class II aldolase/adducin family protein [Acidobacteriota bacterium]|nr:class II aldolase/adducin family protein [Acidobacteriota bacterium]